MDRIDLAQKLATFDEPWSPRIVAEVNDVQVKLVKFQGDFIWHQHEREDELFLVLAGRMTMHFRDRDVALERGQMIVVPHGIEHRPESPEGCSVMLVEPGTTLNTGDVVNERTVPHPERI